MAYRDKSSSWTSSVPLPASFRRTFSTALGLVLVLLCLLYYFDNYPSIIVPSTPSTPSKALAPTQWSAYNAVYVFGDSCSSTSFDPLSEDQPCASNPFGNPPSANQLLAGSTWVHFLGPSQNQESSALLRIYNYAVGGAVVDKDPSYLSRYQPRQSFREQLDVFQSQFVETDRKWNPSETLFITFFGINEIIIFSQRLEHTKIPPIVDSYKKKLEELFEAGARKFLVMNIPPFYHAQQRARAPWATLALASSLDMNDALLAMVHEFRDKHGSDVSILHFDTFALWSLALSEPTEFVETKFLSHLDAPCKDYTEAAAQTYSGDLKLMRPDVKPDFTLAVQCQVPVRNYFWLNDLHATFPVHELMSRRIRQDCFGKSSPSGYCS